jgi:hypothetical protein
MDFPDHIIDWMIEKNYIAYMGENALGEPVYKFTQKFYEEQQELIKNIKIIESDLMSSLWFKNFIDLKMNKEGEAVYYLTDKSSEWYSSEELTEDEKSMMYLLYTTGGIYENYD